MSRWIALVVLLLPALAGCLAPGATVAPEDLVERVPAASWKAELRAPVFDDVVTTVATIASADGTKLSLTLHLPAGLAADAKVPTLLQITPYQTGRQHAFPTGKDAPPSLPWRALVERGAAYVEADARGTNGSEGCLDFGGTKDREDAAAFVAWIREQPWSDGRVVTDGVSHPGMGALVAHAAVPDLTAAVAHAPVVSYYRDEWYQGAKFEDQLNGPFYQLVDSEPAAYLTPDALLANAAPCIGSTAADYTLPEGTHTDKWDDRDLSRHVDQAKAPLLMTQGFVDQNVHPDHVQLYWDALPADAPKWVVWGWWYHGWPDLEGHPAETTADDLPTFWEFRLRFLEAALWGDANGAFDEPRVLVEDSAGTWHEGNDWPLGPSETVTLYADASGALAEAAPSEGSLSYQDKAGTERRKWADAHVAFRTEPLAEARLVNGAPVVQLVASSDVEETKWVVYLLDEAPDGTWERVSHGYADSRTWAGEDAWEPLEPGKAYAWNVTLMPTAVVLEPGHRLTLLVASQDSRRTSSPGDDASCFDDHRGGCYFPSGIVPATTAGRAVNTVLTGPEATRVTLAWVDPALTAKAQSS